MIFADHGREVLRYASSPNELRAKTSRKPCSRRGLKGEVYEIPY